MNSWCTYSVRSTSTFEVQCISAGVPHMNWEEQPASLLIFERFQYKQQCLWAFTSLWQRKNSACSFLHGKSRIEIDSGTLHNEKKGRSWAWPKWCIIDAVKLTKIRARAIETILQKKVLENIITHTLQKSKNKVGQLDCAFQGKI